MNLTEICVRRPVAAWMLMLSIMLVGAVCLSRLGLSDKPETQGDALHISLQYPGASPAQVERDIVEPIEDALFSVEGVAHVTSTSENGAANFNVKTDAAQDAKMLLADVQGRLNRARSLLPAGAGEPYVYRYDSANRPLIFVAIRGEAPLATQVDFAHREVKRVLEGLVGVARVVSWGVPERGVHIWLDADKLAAHRLSIPQLREALQRGHTSAPAGELRGTGGILALQLDGEARDLTELGALIVASDPQRPPVRLADVATVTQGFAATTARLLTDGAPSLMLAVYQARDANAVLLSARVHRALDKMHQAAPGALRAQVAHDATNQTREMLRGLGFELLVSIGITALLCFWFLGHWQNAINVCLAVPISLLGSCVALYACHFTLNLATLLGLTVAVGIVVDDAIMVLESIEKTGQTCTDPTQAALDGTRQVAFAALAATVGVICIFAPVMLMRGHMGTRFLQFGVALSVATALSYLEAVTLAPARCASLRLSAGARPPRPLWLRCERAYRALLGRVLQRPKVTMALSALLCAAGFAPYAAVHRGPARTHSATVSAEVQTSPGSPPEALGRHLRGLSAYLKALPEVASVWAYTDDNGYQGWVQAFLHQQARRHSTELSRRLYAHLETIGGLQVKGSAQAELTFFLRGGNDALTETGAADLVDALRRKPLFGSIQKGEGEGMPMLVVRPQRDRLFEAGLSVQALAQSMQTQFSPTVIGSYSLEGRRVPIWMQLLAPHRQNAEQLEQTPLLAAASQTLIPLQSLTHIQARLGPTALVRRDRQRALAIGLHLQPGVQFEVARAEVEVAARRLPAGVSISWQGQIEQEDENQQQLWLALLLGLAFAYMVLAAQFNALGLPWIVLLAVPLAASGAVASLAVSRQPLTELTIMGILLLFGLVKKNSIMLVDRAQALVQRGHPPAEAALQAGMLRLRPIVMTSCATLCAMLPTALAWGPGGHERQGMAIAIMGGLAFSTALSLIAVPAALACCLRRRR